MSATPPCQPSSALWSRSLVSSIYLDGFLGHSTSLVKPPPAQLSRLNPEALESQADDNFYIERVLNSKMSPSVIDPHKLQAQSTQHYSALKFGPRASVTQPLAQHDDSISYPIGQERDTPTSPVQTNSYYGPPEAPINSDNTGTYFIPENYDYGSPLGNVLT